MIWFFPSSKLYFLTLPSKFYDLRSLFWIFFKFHPYVIWGAPLGLFELHHAVNIFRGRRFQGMRKTCPAHLIWHWSMKDSIGFNLESFKSWLVENRYSTFGINWFCTLLGCIFHGSILDGSFLFPSGSMLLLHVKVRIKLGLCKQPFLYWRMLIWMWRHLFAGLRRLVRPFL